MKLYDSRRAPNPRRVRWVMAEKAIDDIEVVDVDIFKGEHRTPEYRARAGTPQVPALEFDDGSAITESLAICRYLEHLHPEPNLFGRDPREASESTVFERGDTVVWNGRVASRFLLRHPSFEVRWIDPEGNLAQSETVPMQSNGEARARFDTSDRETGAWHVVVRSGDSQVFRRPFRLFSRP